MGIKIEEIRIKNLGKIKKLSEKLGGINLFYGENESGKSLIVEFLIASLFKNSKEFGYLRNLHNMGNLTLNIDGEKITFSPQKKIKLEDIFKNLNSVPFSLLKLLVVKESNVKIEDKLDGIDINYLRNLIGESEVLDELERKIEGTIKSAEVDESGTIKMANRGKRKELNEIEEKIRKIEENVQRLIEEYKIEEIKNLTQKKNDLQKKIKKLELAKRYKAYTISQKIRKIKGELERFEALNLENIEKNIEKYFALIDEIEKKEIELKKHEKRINKLSKLKKVKREIINAKRYLAFSINEKISEIEEELSILKEKKIEEIEKKLNTLSQKEKDLLKIRQEATSLELDEKKFNLLIEKKEKLLKSKRALAKKLSDDIEKINFKLENLKEEKLKEIESDYNNFITNLKKSEELKKELKKIKEETKPLFTLEKIREKYEKIKENNNFKTKNISILLLLISVLGILGFFLKIEYLTLSSLFIIILIFLFYPSILSEKVVKEKDERKIKEIKKIYQNFFKEDMNSIFELDEKIEILREKNLKAKFLEDEISLLEEQNKILKRNLERVLKEVAPEKWEKLIDELFIKRKNLLKERELLNIKLGKLNVSKENYEDIPSELTYSEEEFKETDRELENLKEKHISYKNKIKDVETLRVEIETIRKEIKDEIFKNFSHIPEIKENVKKNENNLEKLLLIIKNKRKNLIEKKVTYEKKFSKLNVKKEDFLETPINDKIFNEEELFQIEQKIDKLKSSEDFYEQLSSELEGIRTKAKNIKKEIEKNLEKIFGKIPEEEHWLNEIKKIIKEVNSLKKEVNEKIGELKGMEVEERNYVTKDPEISFNGEEYNKSRQELEEIREKLEKFEKATNSLKISLLTMIEEEKSEDISVQEVIDISKKKLMELKEKRDEIKSYIISGNLIIKTIEKMKGEEEYFIKEALNSRKIRENLKNLTGNYTSFDIDEGKILVKNEFEEYLVRDLSSGAREQVLLSLRIGFLERYFKEDGLFLILDDAFIFSDNFRKKNILKTLEKLVGKNWQILYFTMDTFTKNLFLKEYGERKDFKIFELKEYH